MHNGQPIDSARHVLYQRLAWALVNRIQCLLRPDEIDDCARQFYLDIRDHMKPNDTPKENGSNVHD
jgi:hypothetical protein